MTFFSTFVVTFGVMLTLTAVIVAWLFRTSSAPFAPKLAIPALLVALACAAPFQVGSMVGLPITASFKPCPIEPNSSPSFPMTKPAWWIYGSEAATFPAPKKPVLTSG